MKIAVVGAGYAGLATTWFLLQKGVAVTVFDGGQGASHVSTGLLHPRPGRRAALTWRAEEGMRETIALLEAASCRQAVFERNGILRIASTEEQKKDFGGKTLWMPEGITVYSRLYLEELKKICEKAQFESRWISDLRELDSFDAIVLTTGAQTLLFAELPLKCTWGQALLCRWRERLPPYSLLANGCHIAPTEHPEFCQVGSTYEHGKEPDPKKALALLEQCALFYPPARDFEVVAIRSALRIAPKVGYRPIIAQVSPKTWVFTGLGSRGLIYHAMMARSLVFNEMCFTMQFCS